MGDSRENIKVKHEKNVESMKADQEVEKVSINNLYLKDVVYNCK
jgi:hypothetical protein